MVCTHIVRRRNRVIVLSVVERGRIEWFWQDYEAIGIVAVSIGKFLVERKTYWRLTFP